MTKTPYFSIITPTYNRAKFLPIAIRSVQEQSNHDYEHIIVDDGSTDGTEELVTSFVKNDSKITYIKQENKGRSTARNVGIDAAKGEYVCFLDSDDYWKPEHLEVIMESVKLSDIPVFAFTSLDYKFPDRIETKEFPITKGIKPIDYVIGNSVSTITVAIHHSVLSKHRFNPLLSINEDLELWARIVSNYPILRINRATAVAVQHESNTRNITYRYVEHEVKAMNLVFNNPLLKPYYSTQFKKQKTKSLRELSIRNQEAIGNRWQLIFELIRFLILYPQNPRNKAKLVMLVYNLPGGFLVKKIFGSK